MNTAESKTPSPRWFDLIPAAAGVQFFSGVAATFRGTPLESALVVGLSVVLGGTIVAVFCFLLRTQITKRIQRRTAATSASLAVSIGLAAVIIAATASGSFTRTADNPAGPPAVMPESSIKAVTVVQEWAAATDDDITNDEVGRWASYTVEQAGQSAKETCVKTGGDARTCAQIEGDETHQVLQIGGRRVAMIQIRAHLGATTFGRVLRVSELKDHKLISVGCARSGQSISLTPMMSPCAEEIKKSLDLTLPQQ